MLDDRPYMRPEEPRFRGPSMQQPWTGWAILLTINVVVFLLLARLLRIREVTAVLALVTRRG